MVLTYQSLEQAQEDITKHLGSNIVQQAPVLSKFYYNKCSCKNYTYITISQFHNRNTEQDALLMHCRNCGTIKVLYENHFTLTDYVFCQVNYNANWKKYYNQIFSK